MPQPNERIYTTEDIYALPEGQRAELIDGRLYMMAPPSFTHQNLVMELSATIRDYIKSGKGSCKVIPAPFAVFLNQDNMNYVEPDISVVCDSDKLTDKGCNGAPDWIIEITSPGTQQLDYGKKLFKYRTVGVREYCIVNPLKKAVIVYKFGQEEDAGMYLFQDDILSCVMEGLTIHIDELL